MKGIACAVLMITLSAPALAQRVIHVAAGKAVLVDGKISPGEWDDAASLDLGKNFGKLYFKRSGDFVYIGVQLTERNQLAAVDMYVDASTSDVHNVYDFHASAKLGERLNHGGWPEWTWWNNDRWTANVARADTFQPLKFLPEPNREFQIARSRIPAKQWAVMFEIMTNITPEGGQMHVFPPGATNSVRSKDWYLLRFD